MDLWRDPPRGGRDSGTGERLSHPAPQGARPTDFLSVVAAAALWGGGGVVGTLLGNHADLPALSIAMWRMLTAGVSLVVFLALTGRLRLRRLTRPMWRRAFATGALTGLFEALFFVGISYSSVGLSTLIGIGSAPVFVAAFDWATTRRRPPGSTIAALALALGGLVALMSGSLDTGRNGLLGALIALGAGATFAAISIVNRHEVPGFGAVEHTGIGFTLGGLMLVPIAALGTIAAPTDAAGWGLVVALGVGITALAYVLFLRGLRTVSPFVATIVTLLEPLVAAVLAAWAFGESLGPLGIVGGAALGAAVILLRPQRDEPETIH